MIVTMLVGAWFLIHQHCCFADAGIPRSILVDPLMRRSPLEKNFIRFGRSWPHLQGFETNHMATSHGNGEAKANIQQESANWDVGPREIRGKENFIRFGRTMPKSTDGEGSWDPNHPDREESFVTANDLELLSNKLDPKSRTDDDIFPRMSRSKQSFIRFGRSNAMRNKNKKYYGHNKDNFIRFGRRDLENDKFDVQQGTADDDFVGPRDTRGKDNSGFIRFGKSIDQSRLPEDRRDKRSARAGESETRCDNPVETCKSCFLDKTLDPTTLVAPEFSLLPKIPFQHTPLKKNFIRLG